MPSLPPPPAHTTPGVEGVLLIAICLDAYVFGLVSQQFCAYWAYRFKDPIYLKLFVIVQFIVVGVQSLLMWHFAYDRFVIIKFLPPSPNPPSLWEGPANSICQLILILLANTFLAARINNLTKNRLQGCLVMALSIIAFVIGMITTVMTWKETISKTARQITSVTWHSVQASAECLITCFLVRMLLMSRSGIRRSDAIVNYLVRSVIQTGCLASVWAVAALISFFFVPHNLTFRVFDLTSGSIYTHAIFDTLISRVHLREAMVAPTHYEVGWSTQSRPRRLSTSSRAVPAVENNAIELSALPPGKVSSYGYSSKSRQEQ
ncbi:hypothetical protein BC827DRAFT_1213407 [Russula dissimulans]|nr:hypothetical protein BC827DRAFT_1213407 [Russula dissimulans]